MDTTSYIEVLNNSTEALNVTRTNTVVTIISIACTIITILLTIKTWHYKKQVHKKLDAFDLVIFSNEFHILNVEISSKIRTANSNKGGRNNKLINDLNKKLVDFNNYEKKLPIESQMGVRVNVDYVLTNIDKIYEATADQGEITRWKSRLQEIDRKLIEITDKMMKE